MLHIGDYMLYYDYYAKVLCVNQDKPKMKCDGKCALSARMNSIREIIQETTNSNENRTPITSTQTFEYWLLSLLHTSDYLFNLTYSIFQINRSQILLKGYLLKPFHPPKLFYTQV